MTGLAIQPVIPQTTDSAVIKVIGVGGGGCNAVANMKQQGLTGVELISANTDMKSLSNTLADKRLQLGKDLTRGLGAGMKPDIGEKAALESKKEIADILSGTDMLFIATGMGGGTGTGASPIVAEVAKQQGILTVAIVTAPFVNEGRKRTEVAMEGIRELKEKVDSLIVIPNEKLLQLPDLYGRRYSFREACAIADNVLLAAVRGVTELITRPGFIGTDFADIRTVMSITGLAMMGVAEAAGDDRARTATEQAIANPLLDNVRLDGARGVLVNITTAPNGLYPDELGEIMQVIESYADTDAEIKFGVAEDEEMDESLLRVTLIATGLNDGSRTLEGEDVLKVVARRTGTDNAVVQLEAGGSGVGQIETGGVIRSARRPRAMGLTAEDFRDSSVVENFERIPSMTRRQAD